MKILMKLNKYFIPLIILLFLATSVQAQVNYNTRYLTAQEIQRVKVVKELLDGIDKKTLLQTVAELEKSRHPQISLEMQEAMAKTYTDIVKEINVVGQKKKEWLYSMVCLNMAYLQFGGNAQGKYGSTTELNRLIRRKLNEYMPPHVLEHLGNLYSLE